MADTLKTHFAVMVKDVGAKSLCGRGEKHLTHNRDAVTCQRCINAWYRTSTDPTPVATKQVQRRPRIKITPESRQAIREGIMGLVEEQAAGGREVRTTSATGGQKGVKEARMDLVPAGSLQELAVLFGRGARKYAPHQWRQGYEWSKAYAALQRHAMAWQMGLDYDVCSNDPQGCQHVDADGNPFTPPAPDTCYNHTGAHHMTAVAWHAFTLLEFKDTHPDHDDRYKIDPFAGFDPDRNTIALKE